MQILLFKRHKRMEIFAKYISDKGLDPEDIKNSYNSAARRQTTQ